MKMYASNGWQNVAEYSRKRAVYPVKIIDVPQEHAHPVCDSTHARNESLEDLINELKQAAGVTSLRYKIVSG